MTKVQTVARRPIERLKANDWLMQVDSLSAVTMQPEAKSKSGVPAA